MKRVCEFLKKCEIFYVATAENNTPHLRPFGAAEIWNNQLIIQTGKAKAVYSQLAENPCTEIVACDGENWLRLSCRAKPVYDKNAEEAFFVEYPYLKEAYDKSNPMAVFALENATAVWFYADGSSETVNF